MAPTLQDLIADALYQTSANDLPAECLRLGLGPGERSEAFSGKRKYVATRLGSLTKAKVVEIAKRVAQEHSSDKLQAAIEDLENPRGLVSNITRHKLAEALNEFSLSGKLELTEMLAKHWPEFQKSVQMNNLGKSLGISGLPDLIDSPLPDLDQANYEILRSLGFLKLFHFIDCSQLKLFHFTTGQAARA